MANANKKIISKGKATEEKEKKPSKSPVTVEVADGVFVFHGGKGGHNITERKNKALEPYGKCIYSYGLLLELIPGDQTSRINQNIGNSRYVHNNYLAERIKYYDEHRETLSIDRLTAELEDLHKKKKAIQNEKILNAIAGSEKSYEEILSFIQGKTDTDSRGRMIWKSRSRKKGST